MMLCSLHSLFCLCGLLLPACESKLLVPYWIVEITVPVNTNSSIRSYEFYLEEIVGRVGLSSLGRIGLLEYTYELHYPYGVKDANYSIITQELLREDIFIRVEQQKILPYDLRTYHLPTDPEFKNQWPWFNTGQTDGPKGLDINVVPIWIQGVSGSGSTVAVIDDGVQITHPDLANNIDLAISYSFITSSNNPSPILSIKEYSHGTNCAGEIVMVTNNGRCGTGVAYNAKLGGIQFLLSDFRPAQEATAFQYRNDAIQIYSNSYGPTDDGFSVGGPGPESIGAIDIGVNQGRNKLGSIYVFSSGNGGENNDSCAADGFINNRHIIGVGSANQDGRQAYYDENCSGKMATTYTFNNNAQGNEVVTTFVSSECLSNFTGTSASAPLMSGVIALAFEVNANLSWRDVQYLIAYTSDSSQLVGDWIINGGGLRVSPQFGFGAIDAEAYVNRARHWNTVDEANETHTILFNSEVAINKSFPYTIEFMISSDFIRYLEHVIFTITFDVSPIFADTPCYEESDFTINPLVVNHLGAKRGDTQITACSPSGTCSVLLPMRQRDFINCEGYNKWDFMSVHFWAENPTGNWTLLFTFDSNAGNAILQYVAVSLYGIRNKPKDIPSSCNPSCKQPTGCSSGGDSIHCDRCGDNYYRNASTMECVRSCSPGACILAGTCLFYNGTCPKFAKTSSTRHDIIIIGTCVGIGIIIACIMIIVVIIWLKSCKQSTKRKHTIINDVDDNDEFPYHDFKQTVTH